MIDNAENRFKFSRMLDGIGILQPVWKELTTSEVIMSPQLQSQHFPPRLLLLRSLSRPLVHPSTHITPPLLSVLRQLSEFSQTSPSPLLQVILPLSPRSPSAPVTFLHVVSLIEMGAIARNLPAVYPCVKRQNLSHFRPEHRKYLARQPPS